MQTNYLNKNVQVYYKPPVFETKELEGLVDFCKDKIIDKKEEFEKMLSFKEKDFFEKRYNSGKGLLLFNGIKLNLQGPLNKKQLCKQIDIINTDKTQDATNLLTECAKKVMKYVINRINCENHKNIKTRVFIIGYYVINQNGNLNKEKMIGWHKDTALVSSGRPGTIRYSMIVPLNKRNWEGALSRFALCTDGKENDKQHVSQLEKTNQYKEFIAKENTAILFNDRNLIHSVSPLITTREDGKSTMRFVAVAQYAAD